MIVDGDITIHLAISNLEQTGKSVKPINDYDDNRSIELLWLTKDWSNVQSPSIL